MIPIDYLSLFSGIGAFEKALENCNVPYNLVGFSEIDKFAVQSYCAIHGISQDKNLGDITKIDTSTLHTPPELVTYGFPCQDISIAGRQQGFKNSDGTTTRSGLFFEALRIISETKPKVAIAENVKALVSKKFTAEFKTVLNSLEEAGYNNYWKVLNAKDYGIPQNRERVFVVSIRKDVDNGSFHFPEPQPLTSCVRDFLETDVDEKYYLSEKMTRYITMNEKYRPCDINGVAYTCLTKPVRRGMGNYIEEPKCIEIANLNYGNYECANRVYSPHGVSATLGTSSGGNRKVKILQDMRVRSLTPREYFRLMGFTDTDFDKASEHMSDAQLYKQAGNSIVVQVIEAIFKGR